MESIIFTPANYEELRDMFIKSQEIIREQAAVASGRDVELLSIQQVCERTGYKEAFIRSRKHEIGYHTVGRDLKFKPCAVRAWIDKYYREPKRIK